MSKRAFASDREGLSKDCLAWPAFLKRDLRASCRHTAVYRKIPFFTGGGVGGLVAYATRYGNWHGCGIDFALLGRWPERARADAACCHDDMYGFTDNRWLINQAWLFSSIIASCKFLWYIPYLFTFLICGRGVVGAVLSCHLI